MTTYPEIAAPPESQERAPLPNEIPEVVERIRLLREVSSEDEVFDRFCVLAARTLRAPLSMVSLIDRDEQIYKGLEGQIPEPFQTTRRTPLDVSLCRHVQALRAPLVIPDARAHPLVCDNPAVTGLGVQSYLGVPLTTSDQYVLGSFCVIDYKTRQWVPEDVEILRGLASLIMIEMDLRLGRAQTQSRLATLQAEEQRRNERTRLLVHDLRTPLNSLLLGLKTIPLLGDLNQDQNESLQLALRGGKTLVQLVDDLLDAEAAEEGGAASLRITAGLDATQLLAQAVSQVAALAAHRGLSLAIEATLGDDAQPQMVTFDADADKLLRALVNLLSNAVKFTPAKGKVSISARDGDFIVFSVRDTGEGIAPENLQRIFERYVHLDSSAQLASSQRSSGLGLSFVKAVAEAHGGRIEVTSVVGEGSVFSMVIPRRQALRVLP